MGFQQLEQIAVRQVGIEVVGAYPAQLLRRQSWPVAFGVVGVQTEGVDGLLQHHWKVFRGHHVPRSLPANSSTISEKVSSAPAT